MINVNVTVDGSSSTSLDQHKSWLVNLPLELIVSICNYLNVRGMLRLEQTCSHLNHIIRSTPDPWTRRAEALHKRLGMSFPGRDLPEGQYGWRDWVCRHISCGTTDSVSNNAVKPVASSKAASGALRNVNGEQVLHIYARHAILPGVRNSPRQKMRITPIILKRRMAILLQNHPNPFNPPLVLIDLATQERFVLPITGRIWFSIPGTDLLLGQRHNYDRELILFQWDEEKRTVVRLEAQPPFCESIDTSSCEVFVKRKMVIIAGVHEFGSSVRAVTFNVSPDESTLVFQRKIEFPFNVGRGNFKKENFTEACMIATIYDASLRISATEVFRLSDGEKLVHHVPDELNHCVASSLGINRWWESRTANQNEYFIQIQPIVAESNIFGNNSSAQAAPIEQFKYKFPKGLNSFTPQVFTADFKDGYQCHLDINNLTTLVMDICSRKSYSFKCSNIFATNSDGAIFVLVLTAVQGKVDAHYVRISLSTEEQKMWRFIA